MMHCGYSGAVVSPVTPAALATPDLEIAVYFRSHGWAMGRVERWKQDLWAWSGSLCQLANTRNLFTRAHTSLGAVSNDARKAAMDFYTCILASVSLSLSLHLVFLDTPS